MPLATTTPMFSESAAMSRAAVLDGQLGGGNRELGKAVHAAGAFLVDVVGRIEILDLGGDAHPIVGCIEMGYGADAGLAGNQRLPVSLEPDSER